MLLTLLIQLKKNGYDTEITEIFKKVFHYDKYIVNDDFNKSSDEIFDERLKQAKSGTKLILLTL